VSPCCLMHSYIYINYIVWLTLDSISVLRLSYILMATVWSLCSLMYGCTVVTVYIATESVTAWSGDSVSLCSMHHAWLYYFVIASVPLYSTVYVLMATA